VTRVAISEEKIALVKNIDATTLRQHILDGKISCVEATAYYARRSFKHGRELCVLAYEHYDRAMKMAVERDEELAKARAEGTVDQLGLFFGVPVSFKDQFSEKGEKASVGSTWMAAHFVAEKDAQLVAMMKREGAIPVVRGSCPQLCWMGHTTNKIFGCGKNPYNPERTVSGSSGGDGALVSARCVPFALGTDIGGSVRAPAACNGIIGFKPTSQRSTQRGVVTSMIGYSSP